MKKLPLSSEDLWIQRWTSSLSHQPSANLRHGIGHDCAVLSSFSKNLDLVLKTDAVVEGIHFTRSTPASLIGRKALARASRIGFKIHPDQIPLSPRATPKLAFTRGEDYELLFSVPKNRVPSLLRRWPFSTPLTLIGHCLHPKQGYHTGGLPLLGYDHLR